MTDRVTTLPAQINVFSQGRIMDYRRIPCEPRVRLSYFFPGPLVFPIVPALPGGSVLDPFHPFTGILGLIDRADTLIGSLLLPGALDCLLELESLLLVSLLLANLFNLGKEGL
jgi:hypothetical protein